MFFQVQRCWLQSEKRKNGHLNSAKYCNSRCPCDIVSSKPSVVTIPVHSLLILYFFRNSQQGSIWVWAQPMRDTVTLSRHLSLAEPIPRMISESRLDIAWLSRMQCKQLDCDTRWHHQMKIFYALLAICARNSPVTCEFPTQRPVTRSFHVFFDLRLNKRLSKQSWG